MSTRPPNENTSSFDHLSMRYLRQSLDTLHPIDEPFVLNPVESRVIRRTKIITLTTSALLGIAGIAFFYWPQYIWPALFVNTPIHFLGIAFDLPLITALYGMLLVYINVNLLVALNLWGIEMIMRVCQFPNAHDAQYERHVQALANAAYEKTNKEFFHFGIDLYVNSPRWGISGFFLLAMAKAVISNLSLNLILKRLFDYYAFRQIINLAGMSLYAVWNTWTSWQILHETQVRIMSPTTIREFVHELHEEWGKDEDFRPLILEALNYVAILKRKYNYAHYMLAETLVDRFSLQPDVPMKEDFLIQLAKAPTAVRHSLERLIVFSVLVDGNLSLFEKSRLRELRKYGFLTYSASEIRRIGNEYNRGRGLWI